MRNAVQRPAAAFERADNSRDATSDTGVAQARKRRARNRLVRKTPAADAPEC
jgi:hypothetical protein